MNAVSGTANPKRRTVLILEHCRKVGVEGTPNGWHQQRLPVLGTKDEMGVKLRERLRHAHLARAPSGLPCSSRDRPNPPRPLAWAGTGRPFGATREGGVAACTLKARTRPPKQRAGSGLPRKGEFIRREKSLQKCGTDRECYCAASEPQRSTGQKRGEPDGAGAKGENRRRDLQCAHIRDAEPSEAIGAADAVSHT